MNDRLYGWKCGHCHGTGKQISHDRKSTYACPNCDSSGNALVDGAARRHQREIDEIERNQQASFQSRLDAAARDWKERMTRTERFLETLPFPVVRHPHA